MINNNKKKNELPKRQRIFAYNTSFNAHNSVTYHYFPYSSYEKSEAQR